MWYKGLEEKLRGEELDLKLTVLKLGAVKQEEEGVQVAEVVQVQERIQVAEVVQVQEGIQVAEVVQVEEEIQKLVLCMNQVLAVASNQMLIQS